MDANGALPEDQRAMPRPPSLRRSTAALGVSITALLSIAGLAPAATASAAAGPSGKFIVQLQPGGLARHAAEHAVTSSSGRITRQLGIVYGFAATMPTTTAARLAAVP